MLSAHTCDIHTRRFNPCMGSQNWHLFELAVGAAQAVRVFLHACTIREPEIDASLCRAAGMWPRCKTASSISQSCRGSRAAIGGDASPCTTCCASDRRRQISASMVSTCIDVQQNDLRRGFHVKRGFHAPTYLGQYQPADDACQRPFPHSTAIHSFYRQARAGNLHFWFWITSFAACSIGESAELFPPFVVQLDQLTSFLGW